MRLEHNPRSLAPLLHTRPRAICCPPLPRWFQLDQLPQLVIGVQSLDPSVQLDTTTAFRKILSIGVSVRVFSPLAHPAFWWTTCWFFEWCAEAYLVYTIERRLVEKDAARYAIYYVRAFASGEPSCW